jgi:hypothetical protein
MIITPNASPETANPGAQNTAATLASLQARRNSGPGISASPDETAGDGNIHDANSETGRLNTARADEMDSGPDDIADGSAADALMQSLRTGFLADPGMATAAQANLSPQSVLGLLE